MQCCPWQKLQQEEEKEEGNCQISIAQATVDAAGHFRFAFNGGNWCIFEKENELGKIENFCKNFINLLNYF